MNLDAAQTDALTELFNIGLHRAAASLSELTGQRILVDLPRLWICPVADIESRLRPLIEGELASVHQIFSGRVSGDAVLLLEYDRAALLTRLMTSDQVALAGRLDESAREVLAEIGNIVLGACLSAFGDMLHIGVTFAVPRIQIESLEGLMQSLRVEGEDVQYAVIAATRFQLSQLKVEGYLIVALGVSSLTLISNALAERVA